MEKKKRKDIELKGLPLLLSTLPVFFILAGIICLIPLILLAFYPNEFDDSFKAFLIPGAVSLAFGIGWQIYFFPFKKGRLSKKEGIFLVVLIWIVCILVCAIPFRIYGNVLLNKYDLNYFDNYSKAIFETTSGFSTTGLTMAIEQESINHLFNFYRIEIGFVGGIGLVLILTSAISNQFGLSVYSAEGHGDKLLPNLVKSSRVIFAIYTAYILAGFGLLWLFIGDQPDAPFDALIHSISAVSTNGITNHSESIAFFSNLEPWRYTGIKITTLVLMILGSTSFFVHMFFFKFKFKKAFNNLELKTQIIETIIVLGTLFICTAIYYSQGERILDWTAEETLANTSYAFVSCMGGVGLSPFSMAEFYNSFASGRSILHFWIIIYTIVMFIGGQTNSAAGGLKQYRLGILFKNFYWNTKQKVVGQKIIFPHTIVKNGEYVTVEDEEIKSAYEYFILFTVIFIIGVLIYVSYGYDIEMSLFEYSSALSNCGFSLGITNSNSPGLIIWADILGMILGRLEVYPFILTFLKLFDVKKKNV